MRKRFFELLFIEMKKNPNIVLLTGGLGYGGIQPIRDNLVNQFYNFEAMEQCMVTAACAMALEGKTPVVYSITPFILRTCYETLKIYVDYEKIPIKLACAGINKDYKNDGISHWGMDFFDIYNNFKNIGYSCLNSENLKFGSDVKTWINDFLYSKNPTMILLER